MIQGLYFMGVGRGSLETFSQAMIIHVPLPNTNCLEHYIVSKCLAAVKGYTWFLYEVWSNLLWHSVLKCLDSSFHIGKQRLCFTHYKQYEQLVQFIFGSKPDVTAAGGVLSLGNDCRSYSSGLAGFPRNLVRYRENDYITCARNNSLAHPHFNTRCMTCLHSAFTWNRPFRIDASGWIAFKLT